MSIVARLMERLDEAELHLFGYGSPTTLVKTE